ncbi:MAG: type II secretion system protein GspM [Rhodoferax sp.]
MKQSGWLQSVQARWAALAGRERLGLTLALLVVGGGLLWQLLLAPALHTLRNADAQARLLEDQWQQMQVLQAQAKALQAQPGLAYDDAVRALQLATQQTLGPGVELVVTAERARVTLKAASADSLARWLAQARLNARSLPQEAHLSRDAGPNGVTWSGLLVMGLPLRQ